MKTLLPLIAMLALTACDEADSGTSRNANDADLVGTVTHVRDGDTIEVAGTPVRLNGLHAPELSEPYGKEAKAMMTRIVDGQRVSCDLNGERSYDRVIGVCYDAEGKDIATQLVEAGLGRDCPTYSGGRYRESETAWASNKFELPDYCT